ncbi:MAG: MoaD/ThiS family protein [Flavobacteriales bacterium]
MILTIKYFGLITEITQCNEEKQEFLGHSINHLKETLINKYPSLKKINFQIAQNQEIVSLETPITGTEIALLPPFSGG